MTVTLKQLSDFGYKLVNDTYFLGFGSGTEELNITNVWHRMSGEISGTSATLAIHPVSAAPIAANFRYRIESSYQLVNGENQPFLNLVIQNDKNGIPTLYAFIGIDDMDIGRAYAGSFIAISDLNEIYLTVENNTFVFYYQPITQD